MERRKRPEARIVTAMDQRPQPALRESHVAVADHFFGGGNRLRVSGGNAEFDKLRQQGPPAGTADHGPTRCDGVLHKIAKRTAKSRDEPATRREQRHRISGLPCRFQNGKAGKPQGTGLEVVEKTGIAKDLAIAAYQRLDIDIVAGGKRQNGVGGQNLRGIPPVEQVAVMGHQVEPFVGTQIVDQPDRGREPA